MTKRELVAIFGGKASGWTKHKNGGGWKYKTATVADSAVIGPDALVYGNAWVSGDALVSGNAWVYGNARVSGNAEVSGDARVYGKAEVSGNAWVYGKAEVSGDAWVYGNAEVYGNALVSGDAWVSGNAKVYGDAEVYGSARVYGNARVSGNAWAAPVLFSQHKFCMNISSAGVLRIGCEHQTFAEWEKNGEQIARKHGELQWYKTYAKPLIPFFEAENERLFGKASKVKP